MNGETGNDRLRGRDGRDDLIGGKGEDSLRGGDGNDRLNGVRTNSATARDESADRLDCGSGGDDFAAFEPGRDKLRSCEQTRRGGR